MKTTNRLLMALLAAGALALSPAAGAQGWNPPGPIKLLIGFAAGGGADTQARLIGKELEKRRGWKILPEQATGRGGLALAAALAKEPADGTAIGIVVSETLGYNLAAAKNSPVTQDDFTPLVSTSEFQMGVVALTSKGWKDMRDVFAAARGGRAIRFGAMSPRLADLAHLLGKVNGVEFNIVQVRGGKAVMNGLNAGDMDVGFGAGPQTKAVKAGEMVNLASAIPKPLIVSPDAPLFSDLGLKFNGQGFFMFIAPAGLPPEARRALAEAIAEVASDRESEAGQFIHRAFGGPYVISGETLDASLRKDLAEAKELLEAVSAE